MWDGSCPEWVVESLGKGRGREGKGDVMHKVGGLGRLIGRVRYTWVSHRCLMIGKWTDR